MPDDTYTHGHHASVLRSHTCDQHADPPGLRFEVGDVYALAAGDDTFDVVQAHQVLQHLPDLARQLVDRGIATGQDLDDFAAAFARWAEAPDAWFAVLHGEVLATP